MEWWADVDADRANHGAKRRSRSPEPKAEGEPAGRTLRGAYFKPRIPPKGAGSSPRCDPNNCVSPAEIYPSTVFSSYAPLGAAVAPDLDAHVFSRLHQPHAPTLAAFPA